MKTAELRQKDVAGLQVDVKEVEKADFNLRMQKGSGQLTQTHQFGRVRREIAQVKFVLGSKK